MSAALEPSRARRARLLAVCAVLAAALLGALIGVDVSGRLTPIDTQGILALRAHASPWTTRVMLAASFIAHGRIAVPFALCVTAALARWVSTRAAMVYAGACLGGEVAMLGIKEAVRHHRPVGISPKLTDAGWYSFPSGHTMLAVIIFGLAAWMLTERSSRRARLVAITVAAAFVVLVALSRVYLGAHWPSDVIGAALAGFACAAPAIIVLDGKGYKP